MTTRTELKQCPWCDSLTKSVKNIRFGVVECAHDWHTQKPSTRTDLIAELREFGRYALSPVMNEAADMLEADAVAHAEYSEATVLMNDVLRKQLMSCQSEREKLRAAAQLALDELNAVLNSTKADSVHFDGDNFHDAVAALKEALK